MRWHGIFGALEIGYQTTKTITFDLFGVNDTFGVVDYNVDAIWWLKSRKNTLYIWYMIYAVYIYIYIYVCIHTHINHTHCHVLCGESLIVYYTNMLWKNDVWKLCCERNTRYVHIDIVWYIPRDQFNLLGSKQPHSMVPPIPDIDHGCWQVKGSIREEGSPPIV